MRNSNYYISLITRLLTVFLFYVQISSGQISVNKDSLLQVWNDESLSDTTRLKAINKLASKGYSSIVPDSAFYYADIEYKYAKSKGIEKYMSNALHIKGMSYYYKGDLDEALYYYNESLKIRESIHYKKGVASSLNNIGAIHHSKGDYEKAMSFYEKSLVYMAELDDRSGVATTLNNLGILHKKKGDYHVAIDFFTKSLKISEQIKNDKGVAQSLNNIAIIYHEIKDYDKAFEYNINSLKINEKIGEKRGVASSLNNIAYFYSKKEMLEKALESYEKSLLLYEELGAKKQITTILNNIGSIKQKLGEYEESLNLFNRSLGISRSIGNKIGVVISLNRIGDVYAERGNYKKAIEYNTSALNLAKEIGSLVETKDVAYSLYNNYEDLRYYDQALTMHRLYIKLKDSISNERNQKEVIRQEYKYAYEKKQISDSLEFIQQQKVDKLIYQNKLDKEENRRYVLYLGIAFLMTLGLFILSKYFKKKEDFTVVQKQKIEINKKHDEKTAMLREIHHRMKNNLNVVNSLLRFQSRKINDKKSLEIFKEAQNRVLSMALLHEKLYQSSNLKTIDVKEHISLLIEDLIRSYSVKSKINSIINIDDIDVGDKTLIPLGLIINEIISNSLKYAFKAKGIGTITVELKKVYGDKYRLIIGDDGVGIDVENEQKGMGSKLIKMFIKQLKGKMKIINATGTVYDIEFFKID